MKQYTTYILDLDGTITDTTTIWFRIFREGLEKLGGKAPDDKTLYKHTHDWKEMLKLGLPPGNLDKFIAFAHKAANERLPKAPLHNKAYEALEALKNHHKNIAIFSSLDRPIFEPVMDYRQLHAITLVAIAGTDVAGRKPKPDGLLKALDDLKLAKEDYSGAVYVGDKATDIEAAKNAGIDGILFYPPTHQLLYDASELEKCNPASTITSWDEVIASLDRQD